LKRIELLREIWRGEEGKFLERKGRGANFIALSKLSLY